MKKTIQLVVPVLLAGAVAWAQAQPPGPAQPPTPAPQPSGYGAPPPAQRYGLPPGGQGRNNGAPPPPRAQRPPMERSLPQGRWWNNPEMVQALNLNSDQQKKMDDIFQQNRLRLIDLNATLQKEELTMEPLMSADTLDETKALAQIDKVAQARAELEKANGRFLVGIRMVLTPDQWKKLQTERRPGGGRGRGGQGGPPAPGRKGGQ